jgi:CheY-like chemotaxis protein
MALEGHCDVLTAPNGQEALKVILVERIDAIILDLMMPVMTGQQLIRELQARKIDVPVIVASASPNVEAQCAELGISHCMQKPYRLQKLLDHLQLISTAKR